MVRLLGGAKWCKGGEQQLWAPIQLSHRGSISKPNALWIVDREFFLVEMMVQSMSCPFQVDIPPTPQHSQNYRPLPFVLWLLRPNCWRKCHRQYPVFAIICFIT